MTYDVSIFLWGRKLRFPSIAAMNPCTDRPVESARIHQIRSGHDGDHVGSLPLEIMLQIAEHMDPADIVRSQRVCIIDYLLISHLFSTSYPNRSSGRYRKDGAQYSRVSQS